MKKIAHLCTNRANYKILEDKLLLLSEDGNFEVHIISSDDGSDSGFLKDIGLKHHFVKMARSINLYHDIVSLFKMIKVLKKEKFDIVHTHTAKAGMIGRIASKIAGVPLIIHTCHGLPFYEGQPKIKYYIYKYLEVIGSMFCDFVASQNKEDLEKLRGAVKESKLVYEGNGVNIVNIDQANKLIHEEDLLLIRKKYEIPNDKNLILVGARFEPVKDHFLILESLSVLKKMGIDNFYCLFAGTGELEESLKSKTRELELLGHVQFVGYQENIYPWIKMVDLVALSSEKEGIPRILMESMAMNKAVVATNVMGTKELVINNVTGLMSEYREPKSFALNLLKLIEDKMLRENLGKNGRKRILDEFTEQLEII